MLRRPSTRAAATYGFSRSTRTNDRVRRAISGHCAIAMTNVITGIDGPNSATTSSSIISSGSDSCASRSREIDGVDPAAAVAGRAPEDDADDAGHQHGQDADHQGHLAAVQDAREQIAAELVGAEQVAVGQRRQPSGGEVRWRSGPAAAGPGPAPRDAPPAGRRSCRPRS